MPERTLFRGARLVDPRSGHEDEPCRAADFLDAHQQHASGVDQLRRSRGGQNDRIGKRDARKRYRGAVDQLEALRQREAKIGCSNPFDLNRHSRWNHTCGDLDELPCDRRDDAAIRTDGLDAPGA